MNVREKSVIDDGVLIGGRRVFEVVAGEDRIGVVSIDVDTLVTREWGLFVLGRRGRRHPRISTAEDKEREKNESFHESLRSSTVLTSRKRPIENNILVTSHGQGYQQSKIKKNPSRL
jgi:hypothetical protein